MFGIRLQGNPSVRRNPVIAGMFTQLDYMEKRGSGLRKMREMTERLPNFLPGKEPRYRTDSGYFFTTFYNLNWSDNRRLSVEEVSERINNASPEKFGAKIPGRQKKVSSTGQKIIDLVIADPSVTA